jgi:phage shock protein A
MTDNESRDNAEALIKKAKAKLTKVDLDARKARKDAANAQDEAEEAFQSLLKLVMIELDKHNVKTSDLQDAFDTDNIARSQSATASSFAKSIYTVGATVLLGTAETAFNRGENEKAEKLATMALKALQKIEDTIDEIETACHDVREANKRIKKILSKY